MSFKIHRVELNNFKSYAGSINIGPLTNFTCIVGPNGSGKSNLMDAISFALTSTSTRSKQHTDFINRNSGATSCSVTIVLRPILANHNINDNNNNSNNNKKKTKDAADEVSFTRRVDDDGEMRVAVNGKDVSERLYTKTLADYRVGSNANTFLVYQHEVELVAQQQAKQLTDLLEKVSGSGELKHDYNQKKAALTAANEALSNASVEKRGAAAQVQQLRLAKKDTERFEELRNTCVEERQEVALAELFFVEGQLEQQKSELHKFSHQLETLRAKITTSDDINNMKRSYAQEHKKYLEELKKNRHLTEEVRNKHNTRERIQAAMAHLTRKLEIATLELKTAQAADTRRAAEIARLEATKEEHVATLKAFEDAIAREDADETNAQQHLTAAHLADFRRLKKEAACATVALRQQLDTLHRKRDGVLEAQRLVEHAREAAALHRSDMSQGRERTVAKQHELKQRQAELSAQIDALTQEVLHTQKDLAQMQRKSAERELDLAKVEEQLHELRHLKDDGKQATRMSDAIQALRALFPIRGRLVDLCNIPNERYRNAITVAMGKNLDAMVVDRTELAIQCVRYLKEQHMPPITFLPLDGLQGKQVDDRLRTFGGTCKPAMDLVRCEAEVEPALRYALGQTLVCDEVVEARKVAYQHPSGERFKVVTLDGTTLLKNGVVQGGLASIATRARRWDEKKYDDLRAHRERLMSGAGSEAELARANLALRDVEARLDYAKKRKEVVAADIVAVEAKLAGLVAELAKQDAADAQLAERATGYANSIHVLEAEALGINKSIAHVETNIFADLQQKVDVSKLLLMESQVAQRATQRAQRRQDLQLLIHRLESSIEMEKLRLGGHTSQEMRQLCARLEKEKKKCEADFATYNTIVAKAEASVAGLKSSVAAQRRELDAMEERIRHATRQSETELRRLDFARKGSTALVAACDALRLRRANIIRECQMSEVELPLKPFVASKRQRGAEAGSSTTNDGGLQHSEPFSLVVGEIITPTTTTSSSSSSSSRSVKEEPHKVFLDFSSLSDARRQVCHSRERFDAFKTAALAHVDQLESEMEALAPSLKAATRCHASEDRLGQTTTHVEAAREAAKKAQAAFQHVKELRTERFLKVFHEVAAAVNRIYQDLTLGTRANAVHGSAYLTLEDAEEPYLGGTTYHATPPLKRFMPMELLSGGEKTMAALALLFAIHAVSPTPFFVLDEVDAALDAGNVEKLAHYLRTSSSTCQFLVVSLKEQLYHTAEMLVGVMKDAERTSSKIITMDLRGFPY